MADTRLRIEPYLYDNRGTWSYSLRVYNDPNRPKPYTLTRSTGLKVKDNTKRKAKAMQAEIVKRVMSEIEAEPIQSDDTVEHYIEQWLTEQSKSLKEITMIAYRQYADKHIIPFFKDVKISEFTPRKVQEYVDLKRQTLDADSIRKHLSVINGAANEATRDGLMSGDFSGRVLRLPKKEKFVGKAYTVEQVRQLLEAAEKEGEPILSAIVLAVFFGLRRSEVCGLRWCDVDLEQRSVHIQNTVVENGSYFEESETTKTKNSNRKLVIPEIIYDYLVKLKARHDELGLMRGNVVAWEDDRVVYPSYITRKRSQLMKKNGLEVVRLHDLRHTAASLMLARGMSIYDVSKFLGHEDITTTSNVYGHIIDEQRTRAAATMNDIITGVTFESA